MEYTHKTLSSFFASPEREHRLIAQNTPDIPDVPQIDAEPLGLPPAEPELADKAQDAEKKAEKSIKEQKDAVDTALEDPAIDKAERSVLESIAEELDVESVNMSKVRDVLAANVIDSALAILPDNLNSKIDLRAAGERIKGVIDDCLSGAKDWLQGAKDIVDVFAADIKDKSVLKDFMKAIEEGLKELDGVKPVATEEPENEVKDELDEVVNELDAANKKEKKETRKAAKKSAEAEENKEETEEAEAKEYDPSKKLEPANFEQAAQKLVEAITKHEEDIPTNLEATNSLKMTDEQRNNMLARINYLLSEAKSDKVAELKNGKIAIEDVPAEDNDPEWMKELPAPLRAFVKMIMKFIDALTKQADTVNETRKQHTDLGKKIQEALGKSPKDALADFVAGVLKDAPAEVLEMLRKYKELDEQIAEGERQAEISVKRNASRLRRYGIPVTVERFTQDTYVNHRLVARSTGSVGWFPRFREVQKRHPDIVNVQDNSITIIHNGPVNINVANKTVNTIIEETNVTNKQTNVRLNERNRGSGKAPQELDAVVNSLGKQSKSQPSKAPGLEVNTPETSFKESGKRGTEAPSFGSPNTTRPEVELDSDAASQDFTKPLRPFLTDEFPGAGEKLDIPDLSSKQYSQEELPEVSTLETEMQNEKKSTNDKPDIELEL